MVLRKALNWSTSEIPIYNILRLENFWIELFYSSITWWYCTGGNPNVGWEKLETGLQLVLLDFVPPLVVFLVIVSPIEVVQIVFILKFYLKKRHKNQRVSNHPEVAFCWDTSSHETNTNPRDKNPLSPGFQIPEDFLN